MSCAQAALAYLDRGYSVLPLLPRSKESHCELLRHTYGDPRWRRLTEEPPSPRDVEGWFARSPEANVGVITGEVSGGLAVFDFDAKPRAPLPRTPTAHSYRGPQLYTRARRPLPNRDCEWGEIRASRKYVVAPPSIHPTGARYMWKVQLDEAELLDAHEVDLAELVGETDGTAGNVGDPHTLPNCLVPPPGPARDLALDEAAVRAVAQVLGAPPTLCRAFRCVVPGHEESEPSASIWAPTGGPFRYHDLHGPSRGDPEWLSLAEVKAAQAYGRVRTLNGPEASRWWLRLGYEVGVVKPEPVELPPVPPGEDEYVQRVADGFRLLWGLRATRDGKNEPVAFAVGFAAAWCGMSRRYAAAAISRLIRLEVLSIRGYYHGRYRKGRLLGPGRGRPPRGVG